MRESEIFLKTNESALYLGVSRSSLVGWHKQDLIQAEATPGGHYRFSLQTLNQFARARNLQVHPEAIGLEQVEPELYKILLIEDDPAFREFIRDALEVFEGYVLHEASDGVQGALLARSWKPDLIILDIRMPNVNGVEFLNLLSNEQSLDKTTVVVASAQLNETLKADLLARGVVEALEKPLRLSGLIRMIERYTPLRTHE